MRRCQSPMRVFFGADASGSSIPLELYRNMTGDDTHSHVTKSFDGWRPLPQPNVLTFTALCIA